MTPCASCASNNPYSCNSCIVGYMLVKGACQADTSCNKNFNCQVCPYGFSILSSNNQTKFNQICKQCTQSNCARCNTANQQCISCLKGYFLNGATCAQCSTGCASCLANNFCLACAMGYVAQQPGTISVNAVNAPLICLSCFSPCQTCFNSPITCTSCVSGFTLKGAICVSSFNFQVNVVFGVTLQAFQQNYFSFINQLASAAQVSAQNILVQSITLSSVNFVNLVNANYGPSSNQALTVNQNSVNVVTLVNANYSPSSNQASTVNQNLNNLFAGNSIAGMPVTSHNVVTNGGTIPPTPPTPPNPDNGGGLPTSTIIILAVCIPVGTLCNFIFI